MRRETKKQADMLLTRKGFLEKGFELFSRKSIETVSLEDVAAASGHGIATLYRYFGSKSHFLVEISQWKWRDFFQENRQRRRAPDFEDMTAAEIFEFYLDSFLEIYRKNKDLLRFNQLLNIYIQSGQFDPGAAEMYRSLMKPVTELFGLMYQRARQDHTVRTDIPEGEMLSLTIHLMLAAVTRYAVGLVYQPEDGFDDEKELETLKEMLLLKYTI